ncbi:hypothetical protein AC1031_006608 [Aphanomyces cochlioides]|nr:hypothetical protein AC1031_006608 [Aphanomyces cochlioides]
MADQANGCTSPHKASPSYHALHGSQASSQRHSPYDLRSSSQRSQIEEKEEERRFDGINFKAEVKLKDTVNQRLEMARSLGIVKIRCTTWDEVYEYLWERYSRYFENLAICNREEEGPIRSIKDGHPTMDQFPKRFSLRLETKQLK